MQLRFVPWSAVMLVLLPCTAMARPVFPGTVRTELALAQDPPCAICHTGSPSKATAKQPFARSLLAHAAPSGSLPHSAACAAALRRMVDDGTDSDGDGLADTAELSTGRDPNTPDAPAVPDAPDTAFPDAGPGAVDAAPAVENQPGASGCSVSREFPRSSAFACFAVALVLLRRKRP